MAWICLQELVASRSRLKVTLSQLPIASATCTASDFFWSECEMKESHKPRFAQMFDRFGVLIFETLTLSTADSHARTSVVQAMESAWAESEADYIGKYIDSLKKRKPRLFSWKTCLQYGPEALSKWSDHLPISAMTVAGLLTQPPQLARHTKGKDGFCLPTPMARDWRGSTGKNRHTQNLPNLYQKNGKQLNPAFVEAIMGYDIGWTDLKALETRLSRSKPGPRLSN